jgi:hypothetical protein
LKGVIIMAEKVKVIIDVDPETETRIPPFTPAPLGELFAQPTPEGVSANATTTATATATTTQPQDVDGDVDVDIDF